MGVNSSKRTCCQVRSKAEMLKILIMSKKVVPVRPVHELVAMRERGQHTIGVVSVVTNPLDIKLSEFV